MPFSLLSKIEQMVDEMLKAEVIEGSDSPWASPVVLVKKKDGGVRFCFDTGHLMQSQRNNALD